MKNLTVGNNEINVNEIIEISKQAGKIILDIYHKGFTVMQKKSESHEEGVSPLTEADTASNNLIIKSLKKLYPNIPIISEESKEISYNERKNWSLFWLVDPLDGTKEFVNKNGEFTVNIALVHNGSPILGVVYVPVKDIFYYGDQVNGSFKRIGDQEPQKLPLNEKRDSYVVVASKSHFSEETAKFVENLKKVHPKIELFNIGSSLKLCMVAEGKADIYPRMEPCWEWDTAAAHAVVKFAGKYVLEYNKTTELRYNKESLRSPFFVVK